MTAWPGTPGVRFATSLHNKTNAAMNSVSILIGIGVVTFAAIAYAAYQTLRADDELWIDDEAIGADAPDDESQFS